MRAANSLDQYSIGCATITEDRMRASPTTNTIGNTATKSLGVPRWQFQGLNHRIEPRFLPLAILQHDAGQRMAICNGNLHRMDATKQGFAGIRMHRLQVGRATNKLARIATSPLKEHRHDLPDA